MKVKLIEIDKDYIIHNFLPLDPWSGHRDCTIDGRRFGAVRKNFVAEQIAKILLAIHVGSKITVNGCHNSHSIENFQIYKEEYEVV
jgi:hypothetical protein